MRSFEKVGLTRQQAERLTEHLTGILCVQKEKLGEQFVSKGMLEKARWLARGRLHALPGGSWSSMQKASYRL